MHFIDCFRSKIHTKLLSCYSNLLQGQARGFGRITHYLPLPIWGHDFPLAIVTHTVDIFQSPGYHMKDMDVVFPKMPFTLL